MYDALREYITSQGITGYRIAEDTSIRQPTIYRFLAGHRGLSDQKVAELLDYLGLEVRLVPKGPAAKRTRKRRK